MIVSVGRGNVGSLACACASGAGRHGAITKSTLSLTGSYPPSTTGHRGDLECEHATGEPTLIAKSATFSCRLALQVHENVAQTAILDRRGALGDPKCPYVTVGVPECLGSCCHLANLDYFWRSRESAGMNRSGGGDGRALRRGVSDPGGPGVMRRGPVRAWRSVDRGTCRPGY